MSDKNHETKEPKLDLLLEKERETSAENFKPLLWGMVMLAVGTSTIFFYESKHSTTSENIPNLTIEESSPDNDKAQKIDQVDLEKKMAIEAAFSQYVAKLEPAKIQDAKVRDAYLSTDYYKPAEKIAVWASLEKGERDLVAIRLWDNYDEDGDILSVQSDGVTVVVPISHLPTTVFIPYKTGTPLIISGVQDGGGGITAAIETQSGPIPLPIMGVGQVLILPVF